MREVVAAQRHALRIPQHGVATAAGGVVLDQHVVAVPQADQVAAAGNVKVLPLDGVAAHRCAGGGVDIDAEEDVDQAVVLDQSARRGGDDARVLAVERVARILDDEAAHGRIGRFNAQHRALATRVQRRPVQTDEGQRPVNDQVAMKDAAGHLDGSARRCV